MKKRKMLVFAACAVLLIAALCATAFAAEVVDSGGNEYLSWTLDSDGVLSVKGTGGMCLSSRSFVYYWDDFRSSIIKVEISEGIKKIESYCFANCPYLTSISIPASVTEIYNYAFESCPKLSSIQVHEENAYYSSDSFGVLFDKDKSNLYFAPYTVVEYSIPESVTTIAYDSFSNRRALTNLGVPNTVDTIDKNAFENCSALKDVYYSGSVEDWEQIDIESGNKSLLNATIHFNSTRPEKSIVSGDVNGDGEVTNSDLVTIARYIVGLTDNDTSKAVEAYSDNNNDGAITNSDLVFFARLIVGLEGNDNRERTLLENKLKELKNSYGVFKSPQNGSMKKWDDQWLDPKGIISATIYDLDNDKSLEMLVILTNNVNGSYCIAMNVYEIADSEVVLSDSMPFAEYNVTDSNGFIVSESTWARTLITADVAISNGKAYILVTEDINHRAFADGSEWEYWILEYLNNDLRYVCSFTQTDGGSSDFEFTGYDFTDGKFTGSALYYGGEEWGKRPLYSDFDSAIKAFFSKYGFIIEKTGSNYYSYAFTISNLENEKVFDFKVTQNSDRMVNGAFNFTATVTRGNNLMY